MSLELSDERLLEEESPEAAKTEPKPPFPAVAEDAPEGGPPPEDSVLLSST